jgi:iron complex outermembrane recepter protein
MNRTDPDPRGDMFDEKKVSHGSWLGVLALSLLLLPDAAAQTQGGVTGAIVDETGAPLRSAAVSVVGSPRSALTDADGRYTLAVDPGRYILRVRLIGYRPGTAEVTVGSGETARRDFTLERDALHLDELVVTATRAERAQKEAALSMSVIPAADLMRIAHTSTAEVLRTIPGIHAEEGGGEVAANVFVRGLPSGGQYRYQTLQEDGMPLRSLPGGEFSAEDVFFREDLNIETLEVAKGGSSTLFGINAPGGIINYRSKTGGDVLRSTLRFMGGERDLYRFDYNTNGPLGKRGFFNVGGFYRYDKGPRVSGLPTEGLQFKANVTVLLEGSGYVRLHAKYLDDRVQFLLPIPYDNRTSQPAIDPRGTLNSAEAADFTIPTPNGTFQSRMDRGVLTKGPTLMLEYYSDAGGGWTLHNKTRLMDVQHEVNIFIPLIAATADSFARRYMTDPATDRAVYSLTNHPGAPFEAPAVAPQGTWARSRPTRDLADQLVVQKRLVAGSTEHRFSVGAYLARTEVTEGIINTTGLFELADRPRLVDLAIAHASGDTTRVTRNGILEVANNYRNAQMTSNNGTIFVGDEMKIGDRLRVDAGVRYERQSAVVRVEKVARYNLGPSRAEQNVAWGAGSFTRRALTFDGIGGSLGVNYAVSDVLNVYGVTSRAYGFPTLGTFAGNVALDSQGNFVQPEPKDNETFWQIEGGLKLSGAAFSGTLAGYWVEIRNRLQGELKVIDGQTVTISSAVGKSRTYGLEAAAVYVLPMLPGGRLQSSVTVQDPRTTDYRIGPLDLSGNRVVRQPDIMFTNSLSYERQGFDLMASWSYLGPRFADDANLVRLQSFGLVSGAVGYSAPLGANRSIRIGVNVYNLFDDHGLTEGDPRLAAGVDPQQFPYANARPVLPRRVKVDLMYSF